MHSKKLRGKITNRHEATFREVMDSHYLYCGDSSWVGTMSKPTKLYNLNINMFSLWYVNFTSHFLSEKKCQVPQPFK